MDSNYHNNFRYIRVYSHRFHFFMVPLGLNLFIVTVDPWVGGARKKKKSTKHKQKKRQTTQDKIKEILSKKLSTNNTNGNEDSNYTFPPRDAIERACNMKDELLEQIEKLGVRLPPNTLDQLIDELGGPENVAEVLFNFLNCI